MSLQPNSKQNEGTIGDTPKQWHWLYMLTPQLRVLGNRSWHCWCWLSISCECSQGSDRHLYFQDGAFFGWLIPRWRPPFAGWFQDGTLLELVDSKMAPSLGCLVSSQEPSVLLTKHHCLSERGIETPSFFVPEAWKSRPISMQTIGPQISHVWIEKLHKAEGSARRDKGHWHWLPSWRLLTITCELHTPQKPLNWNWPCAKYDSRRFDNLHFQPLQTGCDVPRCLTSFSPTWSHPRALLPRRPGRHQDLICVSPSS